MTDASVTGPRCTRRRLLAGAALAPALAPALGHTAQAAEPPRPINGVVIGRQGWLFAAWDATRTIDPQAAGRTTALMGQAIALLKARGIETVVSLLPARSRLYGDFLPEGLPARPEAAGRYGQALRALRAPGTLVPDMAAALAAGRAAQNPLFFKADTHWMPAGAEIAALDFARQIADTLRLPPSTRPGTRFGPPVEMEHASDLARLLPPDQRGAYPGQTYMARPVLDAGGLTDDEGADVALLGNSYMQPRYGFSALLSNRLARPVALMWDVNQTGPYRMLLRYLASEMFRREKPRLIVWNIHELDLEYQPDRQDIWGQNALPAATFLAETRRLVGA